jgi:copper homeostasis protein CutC
LPAGAAVKQMVNRFHRNLEALGDLHSAFRRHVEFNYTRLLSFGKRGQEFLIPG